MEHMGNVLDRRIKESGKTKKFIYEKLGMTKAKFDLLLDTHNIADRDVERVSNIIRNDYDFRVDFPWIQRTVFQSEGNVQQAAEPPVSMSNSEFQQIVLNELKEIRKWQEAHDLKNEQQNIKQ